MRSMIKMIAVGAVALGSQLALGSQAAQDLLTENVASCTCSSKADCTCKKGECKCKKCGASNKVKVYESLKGTNARQVLPDTARRDATAGTFI